MSHFSFLYTGCPYFVSSSAFAMRIRRACIEHGLRMMMYRARPTMHSAVTPPPICPLPRSHTHHTRLPYNHTDTTACARASTGIAARHNDSTAFDILDLRCSARKLLVATSNGRKPAMLLLLSQ